MKKRRSFSREFKREAAGMVLDQGFSYRDVCRQLDLGETGLRRWVEQLQFERSSKQRSWRMCQAEDHPVNSAEDRNFPMSL